MCRLQSEQLCSDIEGFELSVYPGTKLLMLPQNFRITEFQRPQSYKRTRRCCHSALSVSVLSSLSIFPERGRETVVWAFNICQPWFNFKTIGNRYILLSNHPRSSLLFYQYLITDFMGLSSHFIQKTSC